MGKKLTTKDFIERCTIIHDNKYDYSKVEYTGNRYKVNIICPIHGLFEQYSNAHMSGCGCRKCSNRNPTTEEFIEKAKKVHGDKFDYSKVDYPNGYTKVTITCKIHGDFKQKGESHLSGAGCRKCANLDLRGSFENFLKKSKELHGELYDYPYNDYIKSTTKIRIICKEHGIFKQSSNSHLSGNGCPKCANKNITTDEIIEKFNKIHNYKYDYSKVNYLNSHAKVKIICKIHGEFNQSPNDHLNSSGCQECGKMKLRNDFDYFLKKSKEIHGNLYEYFNYEKSNIKVKIKCKKHGIFLQRPHNHISGKAGCPKCGNHISKPETEVADFIRSLGFDILTSKRNIIKPKELDIYIPSLNKAIEFNGYYWHYSKKYFTPGKHAKKSNLCREKGIKLLHIREDLWKRDPQKMKEVIKKFINEKTR